MNNRIFRICLAFASLLVCRPLQAQFVVNGSAFQNGSCYQLTSALNFQSGSIWYPNQVDISEPFDLYFDIVLGCKDADGADGLAFVLQQVSTSVGTAGEGIGFLGIQPSVAVELDTWQNTNLNDPAYDHMALMYNGVVNHLSANNLAGPVPISGNSNNVEDCLPHRFRVTWNPDSSIFRVYFDCQLRLSYTGNIIQTVFNNDPDVFWGFTSATGGFNNVHRVCLDYISFTEELQDTSVCRGESIQLSVGSGDAFVWTPAAGLSNASIANPIATPATTTTYVAAIRDACNQFRYDTVTIFVVDTLQDILPEQVRICTGQPTVLDATVIDGAYFWPDASTGPTFTITQPGLYPVTISNVCGPRQEVVEALPELHPSVSFSPASCPTSANGSISITHPGDPPYTYTVFSSSGGLVQQTTVGTSTATLGGLLPGDYALLTLDGFGCLDTFALTIGSPPPVTAALVSQTNLLCGGTSTGAFTLSGGGGTPPYQYSANGAAFQPSPVLTGLPSGSYSAVVRDANGCTATVPVTLTAPPPLSGALTGQVNVGCFGASTGSLSAAGSGGTGAYTYALGSGTPQPSGTFTGLAAGAYTILVRDANNCAIAVQATVSQRPLLQPQALAQQNIACAGGSTGAFAFAAAGGTAPYAFAFNGGPFGSQTAFSGLGAGPYSLSVRDDSGCVQTQVFTLTEPAPLQLLAPLLTPVDCYGSSSGFFTAQAAGGSLPYAFSLDGSAFQPAALFDSLPIGTYQLVVRDDSSCLDTLSVVMTQPDSLSAAVTDRQDVDCLGNNTGVLAVAGSGGVLPYAYSINSGGITGTFGSASSFGGLFAGFYTLNVRDANGCLASVDTIVTTPTGLAAGIDSLVSIACNGDSTGALYLAALGGTQPYSYTFDFVSFFPGPLLSGLPAFSDTLTLVDGNGCIVPIPFELTEPPALAGSLGLPRHVDCAGNATGQIAVSVSGGVPLYAYSLDGISFSPDSLRDSLSAGTYVLFVRDANGCGISFPFDILEPPPLQASVDVQRNVDCFGNATGGVQLAVTGGVPGYAFSLDSAAFQPLGAYSGLPAGSYQVTVRDDSACTALVPVQITEPPLLTLEIADSLDIACNGGFTGEVLLHAAGGSGAYRFEQDGGAAGPDSLFGGLAAGLYTFLVRDDSACTAQAAVTLSEPPALQGQVADTVMVSCYGLADARFAVQVQGGVPPYAYQAGSLGPVPDSAFTGLTAGLYPVLVTDANSCLLDLGILRITEPDTLTVSLQPAPVRCFGESSGSIRSVAAGGTLPYAYTWSTVPVQQTPEALNLPAGEYGLQLLDANGCRAAGSAQVTEPPLLVLRLDSLRDAFCTFGNGAADVSAAGGVLPYQFTWTGTAAFEGAAPDAMPPGPYLARVTDFNGCQDSLSLVIGDTPPAVPAFVTDPDAGQPVLLSQAEIQFVNQSSGAVAYRWDFGDGRGLSDAVNPVYTYADTGTYEILLTAWNAYFACPTEYRLQVRVIFDGSIYVPNAFTPNGDGQNEAFLVKGEGVVWMELLLFDRWGRLITRFDSLDSRWDGNGPGGGPAPEGVYTYVLRARLNSGRELERGGTVTLIR